MQGDLVQNFLSEYDKRFDAILIFFSLVAFKTENDLFHSVVLGSLNNSSISFAGFTLDQCHVVFYMTGLVMYLPTEYPFVSPHIGKVRVVSPYVLPNLKRRSVDTNKSF